MSHGVTMLITTSDEDHDLDVSAREVVDDLVARAGALSQDSDPEALIAWGSGLARHQHDAAVSAAVFEQLGAEETARLLRLTGFAADRSQTYPEEMEATLEAFKTALASGSSRMDDAAGFASELGRWLLPTELTEEETAGLVANGGLPLTGPAVLAQILRGTTFAPGFLAGLADRIAHFERSGAADPVEYYRLMTPTRVDDYRPWNIAALVSEQPGRR